MAAVGRWWALVVAVALLVGPGRVVANTEGDALYNLRQSLTDANNVLQSWDPTLVNPCTWFHVTCNNDNSVIRVDLGNAQLSGVLVPQLGQLKNLQYLELYSNSISGTIPPELGNLTNLDSRLNNNSLSGQIPDSLTNISTLQVLDLSNNNLSGAVPSTGSFSLFTPISFGNNPLLCGPGTSKPCPGAPPFSPPPPYNPPSPPAQSTGASSTGPIAGGVAAGAALVFAVPAIAFAMWRRRKPEEHFFDVPAEEDPEVHLGQLKKFSLRELQVATDNFSNKNILGRGGFGKVYKGRLADGSLVAVKRLKEERTPGGELQFQTEVEMISMAVHRNLLRLRGFCMTPTERLLVYPYMANGSVASRLRVRAQSGTLVVHPSGNTNHVLEHVKGLLKEKKVEMLVDPDLQNNYQETEVENLIQVALLCTQGSPLDRPKMSEVVRMLEGDGLAERWDEWQKVEVVRQEAESAPLRNDWIVDSTYNLRAVNCPVQGDGLKDAKL
ncbi:hypothetical protein PR202_ga01779 [Eleusine coracana subsp. coracana]|uniref:Protein kinase domain-containing protein n=1 Tax=Eleusine coracana subsp. coracana TaxID=191504 RepID=A0AAV5BHR4_ELECO|nr:hypothetical protein PR202_ga01092 [Eleusine coracana subsp. coracana]GJM85966.1 hypothetical protein PR202_ga01779 [Eleusine coracana subsp. coracana]